MSVRPSGVWYPTYCTYGQNPGLRQSGSSACNSVELIPRIASRIQSRPMTRESGVQGGIAILGNPPTEVQFEFTVFSLLERRAERRAEWTIAKSRHGSLRNGAYQEKSLRFARIDFNAYSTFLRPQPIDDRYLRNATR